MLSTVLTFDRMLSSFLVKIVYWIGLVGILGGAAFTLFGSLASMSDSVGAGIGGILLVGVGCPIALVLWRMMCESMILMFGMYDRLGEIRDRLGAADQRLSAK